MKLTEATPSAAYDIGRGEWLFQIGEVVVGRDVGVVYLLALSPKYGRFKVVEQVGAMAYQVINERPLTDEEREYFARWRKKSRQPETSERTGGSSARLQMTAEGR